jgi:hypothetical protein
MLGGGDIGVADVLRLIPPEVAQVEIARNRSGI